VATGTGVPTLIRRLKSVAVLLLTLCASTGMSRGLPLPNYYVK